MLPLAKVLCDDACEQRRFTRSSDMPVARPCERNPPRAPWSPGDVAVVDGNSGRVSVLAPRRRPGGGNHVEARRNALVVAATHFRSTAEGEAIAIAAIGSPATSAVGLGQRNRRSRRQPSSPGSSRSRPLAPWGACKAPLQVATVRAGRFWRRSGWTCRRAPASPP
jgi:hypothetical protein